jgi:cap1 methyltransferase
MDESEWVPTKRRKLAPSTRESECGGGGDDRLRDCGSDFYDEILEGLYEDDDSGRTRNSWLVDRSDSTDCMIEARSTVPSAEVAAQIRSLSQQLIQTKRRLWPAAELCGQVWQSNPQTEFWKARASTNPMETLGERRHRGMNQMFINRSAIKLANVDAILDFGLTRSAGGYYGRDGGAKDHQRQGGMPFLFADLCGAPGGFSEYLLKRCQSNGHSCRGYGMSLDGLNEHGEGAGWRLRDVSQRDATRSLETSYRICGGADGTGDIYQWENVLSMRREIEQDLLGVGIGHRKMDLVVADGGFDAQRDSECQEELAQKIVLCELAASLELLEVGGTLVMKMFGTQTESVRMAVRCAYEKFDKLDMIKPVSSRPASSERYAVFLGFRGLSSDWVGGQKWISSIMLGRCLQNEVSHYYGLDCYLNEIDRDMLALNLKACFAILSYLQKRTEDGKMHSAGSHPEVCPRVNVNEYKHAWDLSHFC